MSIKCYRELVRLPSFEERFRYLKLHGRVGEETFGFDRYLNQTFYRSAKWKSVRDRVIIRDGGCDLGIEDREIRTHILIHHMNPITVSDIERQSAFLMDPEYLVCVSTNTHNAIHYGNESLLFSLPPARRSNDMCPWKK